MKIKYISLLIIVILYSEIHCNENEEAENDEKFVATQEWQVIKKGQKVPRGLHYRINLETGSTEAKLMGEAKSNERRDLVEVPSKDEKLQPSIDEIKDALKNIKGDDVKSEAKINSKFRSYEQLKEELGVLNLTSKVDSEIISDLIKQHQDELEKDEVDVETIVNILEDLDYLAHQFDNGLEFVNQNGFRDVIHKNLNGSSDTIKGSTLKLFGSLLQNNARVQIHALETGSLPTILRFLSSDSTSEQLKSNAMFALGCLLRRFPLAQQKFVDNGGLFIILQLLEKSSLKIQLKIVTLLTDFFIENRQAEESSNQILLNQYKFVNIEKKLLEQNFCLHIDRLLVNIVDTNPEDYDSIEKVLITMQIIADKCSNYNKQFLKNLGRSYEKLAETDSKDDDNFFKDLAQLCLDILSYKKQKTEL